MAIESMTFRTDRVGRFKARTHDASMRATLCATFGTEVATPSNIVRKFWCKCNATLHTRVFSQPKLTWIHEVNAMLQMMGTRWNSCVWCCRSRSRFYFCNSRTQRCAQQFQRWTHGATFKLLAMLRTMLHRVFGHLITELLEDSWRDRSSFFFFLLF